MSVHPLHTSETALDRWKSLSHLTRIELDMIAAGGSPWNAIEAKRMLADLAQYDRTTRDLDPVFADAAATHALAMWGPNGKWPAIKMMARSVPAYAVFQTAGGARG